MQNTLETVTTNNATLSNTGQVSGKPRNRAIAMGLSAFPLTGILGLDRFYLGQTKLGILKAVTFGGLGLWWFADAARLGVDAFLYSFGKDTGFVKDAQGHDLKHGMALFRWKDVKLQRDWFTP